MASLVGAPWMRIRVLPDLSSLRQASLNQCYKCNKVSLMGGNHFSVSVKAVKEGDVRVRFAPSHTGHLYVGGARTALFNYLLARSKGGKFVLRIEDTDLERSTREPEEALIRDLSWLGLDWDEGPGVGGDYGPYRQSERNSLYKQYADKLLQSGHVYRCFCSSEELESMKEIAKLKNLPPVYTGKWANATVEEVEEELEKGTPFTYRFRVPKEGHLKIDDLIRGEVSWNLNTLGDFVIMRSNGQPVYNFCVTVDDANMAISHVIRAEEHLPNTLRQGLIYKALKFRMPRFAHVSLILAPDRSKTVKTSWCHFRRSVQGNGIFSPGNGELPGSFGLGDGTDNEFFTLNELVEKFSISRVNKAGAIFDDTNLRWMNGHYLHSLPPEELTKLIGQHWKTSGILAFSEGPFVDEAIQLLKDGINLVTDSDGALLNLLSYPLHATLESAEGKPFQEDKLSEFSASLLAAYESGELLGALNEGHAGWQKWVKSFGKSLNRKGKSLFMPLRVLLTGKLQGPDMGLSLTLLYKAGISDVVTPQAGFVTLEERFKMLKELDWEALNEDQSCLETAAVTAN